MLCTLYIRNFALIQELTVEFKPGLTIITGETGAGKSILIGALNLVLGERASSDLVRSGAQKAVIEALFSNPPREKVGRLLEDSGIEPSAELILRRELSATAQSRCFINDTPATVALLKQVGELLIDLHGQHEHQLLLRSDTHETLLDDFAGSSQEVAAYRESRSRLHILRQQLLTLEKEAAEIRDKKELLDFQLQELSELDLKAGEEEDIESEITLLENAETLFSLTSSLNEKLYDGEHSVYSELAATLHTLEKLSGIDPRFEGHAEDARTAKSIVDELARFSRSYISEIDFNLPRLDKLRQRQLLIQRITRKYGRTLDELIALREELDARIALEDNLEAGRARMEAGIAEEKSTLSQSAIELSEKRKAAARNLETVIQEQLARLGIPGATFIVGMKSDKHPEGDIQGDDGKSYAALANGFDHVEFLVSANPGEEPRPLVKVASGGEISRIMLAMKSALAASTELPILVFDEIDTGISGRIAEAVGKSLKSLSRKHQIIAITHLPQIAAMGDLHLSVQKSVQEERTVSGVVALDHQSRLKAIASLISGSEISPSSLKLAAELVEAAKTA
ncbi:MAG: DNA repair protein RecN [Chlorobiaceae bacterium]